MAEQECPDLILMDINLAMAAGFNDYITKPFETELVIKSIEDILIED